MDKMVEQQAPTLEARYKALEKENEELKNNLLKARKYIEYQKRQIDKLERSMLSAVTSLKWGD